jgi:DUF1680 family protein
MRSITRITAIRASKFYFDDKWPCCSGTLPQVAADYHILGYFHDGDGVYVNLYMPSTLKWTAENGAHLALTQSGGYPLDGGCAMVMKASKSADFALRLRIPVGAAVAGQAAEIRVNGLAVNAPVDKGFAVAAAQVEGWGSRGVDAADADAAGGDRCRSIPTLWRWCAGRWCYLR